jgi:ADP-ribosylation factor family
MGGDKRFRDLHPGDDDARDDGPRASDAGFGILGDGIEFNVCGRPEAMRRCAVIFVVDSNDRDRITRAAELLGQLDEVPELAHAPLLVWANKQDLPNAMPVREISDELDLGKGPATNGRNWFIQASCAVSGDGL